MSKRVLVITDIENDDMLALEKARDIALPMAATMEIIKFINHDNVPQSQLAQRADQEQQSLSVTLAKVFESTADITSQVIITNNLADWVVKYCEQHSIDLVIKAGHRSESLFHTPCDWQLIRNLACPILIASNVKWKTKANILLALNLSSNGANHHQLNGLILDWGQTWSQVTQSQLHATYSIPIAKPLLEFDVVDAYSVEQKKAPAAKEKMHKLLADFDMESIKSHISAGPPDRTIPHMANQLRSNLVIIGSVGRAGISSWLLGNIAEKVLHHLRTDCLIIKRPQD